MALIFRLLLLFIALIIALEENCVAQDALLDGDSVPDSVEDLSNTFEAGFRQRLRTLFSDPLFKNNVEDWTPFVRDTELTLNVRSYYLSRNKFDNSDSEAWALGGSLRYHSGEAAEMFSVGAEVFTSQKLFGPESKDGTLLLKEGQEGYTVLGTLFTQFAYKEQKLKFFRQDYDLPFLNRQDSRMTPNTFEAYSLSGQVAQKRFAYILGYVAKIKTRNNTSFKYMSEVAGAENRKKGLWMAGGRFFVVEDLSVGAIDYLTPDTLNIFYAEADYKRSFAETFAVKLSLQFGEQRSVGDDLLTGESYDTNAWGALSAFSFKNSILTLAFTEVAEEASMLSPYGSYPGYNSSIIEDFERAGEEAWRIGLSYDLKAIGFRGASVFVNYIDGSGAREDFGSQSLANKEELDFTFDYRFQSGGIEGFWIRLRAARVREDGGEVLEDYRVILNHALPLI